MIKGSLYVNYKFFLNNKIFSINDSFASLKVFSLLKKSFQKHGINIATQDINCPNDSSFTIFNDVPNDLKKIPKNSYLILWESEVVIQDNWNKKNHNGFKKIFTWNDDIIDNIKYFKITFPHDLELKYDGDLKNNFICMISSNKRASHKNELYSERLKIIKWYEDLKTKQFQFYGNGWDKLILNSRYLNFVLRKTRLDVLLGTKYTNYKGVLESKSKTLNTYLFCFCLENAFNYNGYITEKIFDCFASLTIPIYKGPPNTLEFIPKECFIDYDKFNSLEDLNYYLNSLSLMDIEGYQNSIITFLDSEEAKLFSHNNFAEKVVKEVVKSTLEN